MKWMIASDIHGIKEKVRKHVRGIEKLFFNQKMSWS